MNNSKCIENIKYYNFLNFCNLYNKVYLNKYNYKIKWKRKYSFQVVPIFYNKKLKYICIKTKTMHIQHKNRLFTKFS